MVHRRGMKLIVYVSSGYFERTDPDFRRAWPVRATCARSTSATPIARRPVPGGGPICCRTSCASWTTTAWTASTTTSGYEQPGGPNRRPPDEVLAFEEDAEHDGASGRPAGPDLRRGQAPRRHRQGPPRRNDCPADRTEGLRLSVGRRRGPQRRRIARGRQEPPPYVVPCLDMSRAKIEQRGRTLSARHSLHAVPAAAGGPAVHRRAGVIPGIEYPPEEKCFWTRHCRAIWRHYQRASRGPAQLRLVGFGARPARGPAHARPMARTVPADGRRGHLGVAGGERWKVVGRATSARRRRLGVRQPRLVHRAGQLWNQRGGRVTGRPLHGTRWRFRSGSKRLDSRSAEPAAAQENPA